MPEHDKPPATRREHIVERIHGQRVADPYRWLEPGHDADVRAWADAQDHYARKQLEALPHREALARRLTELLYIDRVSPPIRRGEWLFYVKHPADREKGSYYARPRSGGPERLLVDPEALPGNVSLRGMMPSKDGRILAYKLSLNGADAATIRVLEVESGHELPDVIEGARYARPSWTPDGRGFYYVGLPLDPSIPPAELPGRAELRFHRLGTPPSEDVLVHPATGDPTTFLHGDLSRDGRWLVVTIWRGFDSTDVYVKDLVQGEEFVPLVVGSKFHYDVIVHAGRFYVHTNDDAPRYRVLIVDPSRLERKHWREIVPEPEVATLESMAIVGGRLILGSLERASSRLAVHHLDGRFDHALDLPPFSSASTFIGRPEDPEAYFYLTSFVEPTRVYQTQVATGEVELWQRDPVPFDGAPFEVQQLWYPSKDGTQISMFVVHRRGLVLDGSHPTLLTGYGGFGVSLTPWFSSEAAVWLEHGGVYAVPNLRGGGEYGEAWHEAGKLHKKQNVFDDFIAAAETLIARGYTTRERLAIKGGSNGGLLVGAVSTQRPELFGAVVCAVPLLDMIRYHRFGAGQTWTSEYGSSDDPEHFRTLFAYSPYHHVRSGVAHPPLLMLSADNDDRVDPLHARKYVAAVQAASPATPALLRVEREAGHGGGARKRQHVEENIDALAFLLHTLGVTANEAETKR